MFDALRGFVEKTAGIAGALREALLPLADSIDHAFLYGSIPRGEEGGASDIDLMVVGKVSNRELAPVIARVERRLGREVNYALFERREIEKRLGRAGDFVHEVFDGPRILLIGDMGDRLLATAE